jgi:hypothetical protein
LQENCGVFVQQYSTSSGENISEQGRHHVHRRRRQRRPSHGAAASRAPRQASTATAQRAVDAQAVVGEVRKILAERYVLPERRPALDAVLARASRRGGTGSPIRASSRP